jgi:hypothetical protein
MSEPFVLLTAHGTVVFINPETGDLVHQPPATCTPNLAFVWDGEALVISDVLKPPKPSQATLNMLRFPPAELVFTPGRARFGFKLNGKFASADGHVARMTFDKPHFHAWEQFSALSLFDFYEAKIAAFGSRPMLSVQVPYSAKIPRKIHQIFISDTAAGAQLPDAIIGNIANLKQLNPGWSYQIWTKKDIHDAIYDWFGFEILDLYLRLNPRYAVARADLFRYLCIYKLGGVYLDIKSGARAGFDDILRDGDQYLLSQWNNVPGQSFGGFGMHPELSAIEGGEFQQWQIISAPGHPFLEHVIRDVLHNIKTYDRRKTGVGRMGVLRLTGPIAYTLAIQKVIGLYQYRKINSEDAGLIYHALGSRPNEFSRHYSTLDDDIVL